MLVQVSVPLPIELLGVKTKSMLVQVSSVPLPIELLGVKTKSMIVKVSLKNILYEHNKHVYYGYLIN